MAEKARFVIPKDGLASGKQQVRAIYSAESCQILEEVGKTETQRASHVEPGSELSQEALVLIYPTYSQAKADALAGSAVIGHMEIKPEYATHWFADMTPTARERVLGPFPPDARDTALAAEVAWLKANNLPVCEPCIEKQHTCCNPDTTEDAGKADLRHPLYKLFDGFRRLLKSR